LKEIELEPTPLVEPEPAPEVTGEPDDPISAEDFSGRLSEVERSMLMAALGRNRWNVGHTAQALGVSRRTLQRRIRKYD
jgi:transcriptional regulator of acetoin/glycerol metabolism